MNDFEDELYPKVEKLMNYTSYHELAQCATHVREHVESLADVSLCDSAGSAEISDALCSIGDALLRLRELNEHSRELTRELSAIHCELNNLTGID